MPAANPHALKTQLWRGLAGALPVMMGYFPIGFAFGVLAVSAGMSPGGAAAMSAFVYAGSAQFMAVGLLESGVALSTLAATVFLVNLRHLLMSAYLAPFLGRLARWQQAWFCFELTDETFAVHSTAFRRQGAGPPAQLLALNLSAHLSWIGSTVLGAWLGSSLNIDTGLFGLDYALPAMFIALLVMQINGGRRALIALLAAAVSILLYLGGLGHWSIIVATVAAATVGALSEPDQGKKKERAVN